MKLSMLIAIQLISVGTVASKKFWSSMSLQNLVRLSQIRKISLPDYAHVNKMSKKFINQCQLMSYNMMILYYYRL
jgi:hypothetical protein